MNITFSTRHFEASEKLQSFAMKEFQGISKFSDDIVSGGIVLEENGNQKETRLRLNVYGRELVSKAGGTDFYKIIPAAVDKLKTQLKSKKSKVANRV